MFSSTTVIRNPSNC